MEFFFGIDLISFIRAAGYLGLFFVVFAESGLFAGFFLPGDSLLFTAGFLAAQGYFSIFILVPLLCAAAVLGDNFGYAFGKKIGPKLFRKEDSFFFHKDHIDRAREFYRRFGGKTIIIARFVPMVRTFAPILAGVGEMPYRTFFFYNILGGCLWAIGVPSLGFLLGNIIPNADAYLLPLILAIVVVSFLPAVIPILREKEHREKIKSFFRF
ncbi:MAG: VTT domain-containing protein [bacterium]|nr:VTT domain-containing protein [bacterium]